MERTLGSIHVIEGCLLFNLKEGKTYLASACDLIHGVARLFLLDQLCNCDQVMTVYMAIHLGCCVV